MTRPMTNAQLSLMAVPIDRRLRNDSLVWFLTDSAVFGAGIASSLPLSSCSAIRSDSSRLYGANPIQSPQHSRLSSVAL
jgi:hypothetical protein